MKPTHDGEPWTQQDENKLKRHAQQNMPTEDIAKDLGRTESAIRSKASEHGISLKPKDK